MANLAELAAGASLLQGPEPAETKRVWAAVSCHWVWRYTVFLNLFLPDPYLWS